jgi:hypothetical protein
MSDGRFEDKLKFELAALRLSTDERLAMVGKCHLSIKVFGKPETEVSGSITFGFPSDRRRIMGPVQPDQVALFVYDYLLRYKLIEQAQQAVGHVPIEEPIGVRKTSPVEGWADNRKRTAERKKAEATESLRRVFAMPSSEIRAEAKDVKEIRLEDFKEGTWVVTAKAELKLAKDLEVIDLPPDQIMRLRALTRKLRELEAAL